jgi:GT2 family glycosyltransferase
MSIAMPAAAPRARPGATSQETPAVLAVVVTHQGRTWLKDCLVALNAQTYGAMDILVVDDASPDSRDNPQLKRIVKRHSQRRRWAYLRTPRPLGFGGAINWALSRVRTNAQLLLFLHDDAALDRDALDMMVQRLLADDKTAIVGPKVVSWDDPASLEEVGMAVDRFGYPYKGLERGEIDLGQHDASFEVFFVTSTCMLIRHEVFRALRGWDAYMRAFSEDLDLCWRSRVMGHSVRVEPRARARHAIALATGRRKSGFVPLRYFIRRNRLRAVAKNASAIRLVWLLPQFFLLSLAEMLGFVVLRQYGEIVNIARALGWNFLRLPQTLAARRRVQRAREVPDRRLSRLTVRESTRMRAYVGHQAERLEVAWGRRAQLLARPSTGVRALRNQVAGRGAAVAAIVVAAAVLGFRHFLFSPQLSAGELLAYPDSAIALARAWMSQWRETGLGQPWPTSPALLWLGAFPLIAFGVVGVAQKLLILSLGVMAYLGASRVVSGVVDRHGRLVSGLAYALGAVGYAGIREGALGALVLGAAAPFILMALLRLTGWARPPGYDVGSELARVAVASAIAAGFVPGALIFFAGIGVLLAMGRAVVAFTFPLKGLLAALAGFAGAWVLLLPWSWAWLQDGHPLSLLLSEETRGQFTRAYAGEGVASLLLSGTPEAPRALTLALVVGGLLAVTLATGQRRRVALALWLVVAATAVVLQATSDGLIPPVMASPTEMAVVANACLAALAGLAVGAVRLDLPRRGLGWWQPLALGGFAAAVLLFLTGLLPALWRGEWAPGAGLTVAEPETVSQALSVLEGEAEQEGSFRALWVGEHWASDRPSVLLDRGLLITGPRGQILTDLFDQGSETSERRLEKFVLSIAGGGTDRGGELLGAFDIEFVVLERGPGASRWLAQRDFAVARAEPGYYLLQNSRHLPSAGVYPGLPGPATRPSTEGPLLAGWHGSQPAQVLEQRSAGRYTAEHSLGAGVLFVSEARNERWKASLAGRQLRRVPTSWGNAFEVPAGAGRIDAYVPRPIGHYVWMIGVGLAWVVAVGAALFPRPGRREQPVEAGS